MPYDIIERILQCCHVDLLVYHVSGCLSYYVGQFMLFSIKCIQPVQFDSVHATKFIFHSVFLVDSSDKIRLLVSFCGSGCSAVETPRLM